MPDESLISELHEALRGMVDGTTEYDILRARTVLAKGISMNAIDSQNENAMCMVRKLLAAAHQFEAGDPEHRDTVWADALGARAANLLAGVVYRNERRIGERRSPL